MHDERQEEGEGKTIDHLFVPFSFITATH